MMKEQLRTIKYRGMPIIGMNYVPMTKDELLYNKEIIERRMKERRHNSRQNKRDRVTLAKITNELNGFGAEGI